ncbi:Nup85 nucleoporin-domain-containing protein [Syncephalastrum racemosum]|uniref:Nuclear pore complex protein Nup85 n=1 Tax=Syncephalastrum racemosum TaxID=13706 RepID=A0A1X2HCI7_SYNRA|nr:Nup85 nucleoporin-domain-containing protein [Syncephalastrum racemosum]
MAAIQKSVENIPLLPPSLARSELLYRSAVVFRALHANPSDARSPSELRPSVIAYTDLAEEYLQTLENSDREFAEASKARLLPSIWRLVTFLYFPPKKVDLAAQLLSWIESVDKGALYKYDIQGIFNHRGSPLDHTEFWPFINRLIFRRDLKTLAKMLQLAKERETERAVLDYINLLIAAVSQKQKNARISVPEPALPAVSRDRVQAQRAWDAIQLMQGDRIRLASLAVSGAEAVVGLLTYAESDVSSREQLHQLANFVALHRKSDVYLELLRGDFAGALAHMEHIDWWLSMHLLDLMDVSTHTLAPAVVANGAKVGSRAWIVMVYTRYLRNEERLWPYILDYVATCDGDADICLKKCINYAPRKDPESIKKMADYCKAHNMISECAELERIGVDMVILQGKHTEALQTAVRLRDPALLERATRAILRETAGTGKELPRCDESGFWWRGPHAKFYIRYIELQNLYKQHRHANAVEELIELVEKDQIPRDLFPLIFAEAFTHFKAHGGVTLTLAQIHSLEDKLSEYQGTDDDEEPWSCIKDYSQRVSGTCIHIDDEEAAPDTVRKRFLDQALSLLSGYRRNYGLKRKRSRSSSIGR